MPTPAPQGPAAAAPRAQRIEAPAQPSAGAEPRRRKHATHTRSVFARRRLSVSEEAGQALQNAQKRRRSARARPPRRAANARACTACPRAGKRRRGKRRMVLRAGAVPGHRYARRRRYAMRAGESHIAFRRRLFPLILRLLPSCAASLLHSRPYLRVVTRRMVMSHRWSSSRAGTFAPSATAPDARCAVAHAQAVEAQAQAARGNKNAQDRQAAC